MKITSNFSYSEISSSKTFGYDIPNKKGIFFTLPVLRICGILILIDNYDLIYWCQKCFPPNELFYLFLINIKMLMVSGLREIK